MEPLYMYVVRYPYILLEMTLAALDIEHIESIGTLRLLGGYTPPSSEGLVEGLGFP